MKFKAFFTDKGVTTLEKKFVPAFEKIGKTCYVYLTRTHVTLMHNAVNADGVQAIAQFKEALLFDDYRISSQNEDRIAFALDLNLLLRALKSSVSMDGDKLQIKLVKKRPSLNERPMPYLTLESKGFRSAVVQDIPISQPLSRGDVQELQDTIDAVHNLPRTLVQMPDLGQLQILVDRLKNVGEALDVAVTFHGDVHLQVSTTLVSIGSEFRRLQVLGERAAAGSTLDATASPATRLEQALARGEASSVQVKIKHFAKSLQCSLTRPDTCYVGVAPSLSYLVMKFQFYAPATHHPDTAVTLHYRLPVLERVG
ncbi:hypothetical protein SELMODRAFT_108915 [Selaginella moellendorffii]|uniref:Checkpoint protein n=1 Tax=Selaginella moellendorffii TaxID=88036 RepID=D8S4W7_SELML|nr:uncharacterized protein LOC9653451 [Selaginella moellendorffii]EFJ20497.1 hypothetical protein SELMODRAFT_108915 [Selaginella moellendorffii]|eukprot:XP_002978511.1 uncharacterized protein LOC9653451 [Selaginella moellendorffii]